MSVKLSINAFQLCFKSFQLLVSVAMEMAIGRVIGNDKQSPFRK